VELRSGRTLELLWRALPERGCDSLGAAVVALDFDLDGDGVRDVAAGAPDAYDAHVDGNAGLLRLLSGKDGSTLRDLRVPPERCQHHFAFVTEGEDDDECYEPLCGPRPFAACVARLSDRDGDGAPELALGSPDVFGSGEVWVVSGRSGALRQRLVELHLDLR
jgi:hypothetical protein